MIPPFSRCFPADGPADGLVDHAGQGAGRPVRCPLPVRAGTGAQQPFDAIENQAQISGLVQGVPDIVDERPDRVSAAGTTSRRAGSTNPPLSPYRAEQS